MDTTFSKGLSVIEALAQRDSTCGVTELSKQLGLTKSNVHRLLQTLVWHGYVRKCVGSGRYELTLKVWELGAAVIGKLDLKRVASEYLAHLGRLTEETVHLSVLDGGDVIYVDKVDSPQPVRAYSVIGGRAPAYCVATGKVLLAHAPSEVVDKVCLQLQVYTPVTISSPGQLKAELQRVRENGYAVNKGEWREGVCGLAAPIRDSSGAVVAAVGISGPVDRLKPRVLRQLAPTVINTAQSISLRLGYSPEPVAQNSRHVA